MKNDLWLLAFLAIAAGASLIAWAR